MNIHCNNLSRDIKRDDYMLCTTAFLSLESENKRSAKKTFHSAASVKLSNLHKITASSYMPVRDEILSS